MRDYIGADCRVTRWDVAESGGRSDRASTLPSPPPRPPARPPCSRPLLSSSAAPARRRTALWQSLDRIHGKILLRSRPSAGLMQRRAHLGCLCLLTTTSGICARARVRLCLRGHRPHACNSSRMGLHGASTARAREARTLGRRAAAVAAGCVRARARRVAGLWLAGWPTGRATPRQTSYILSYMSVSRLWARLRPRLWVRDV